MSWWLQLVIILTCVALLICAAAAASMAVEDGSWRLGLLGVVIFVAGLAALIGLERHNAAIEREKILDCFRQGGQPVTSGRFYAHLDVCVIVVKAKP